MQSGRWSLRILVKPSATPAQKRVCRPAVHHYEAMKKVIPPARQGARVPGPADHLPHPSPARPRHKTAAGPRGRTAAQPQAKTSRTHSGAAAGEDHEDAPRRRPRAKEASRTHYGTAAGENHEDAPRRRPRAKEASRTHCGTMRQYLDSCFGADFERSLAFFSAPLR
jgi:hypothetical protein